MLSEVLRSMKVNFQVDAKGQCKFYTVKQVEAVHSKEFFDL